MEKGKLIVIEGACDGIGKSTQFEMLKNNLLEKGYDVETHHFPSNTEYQGDAVVRYLNGEFGKVEDLSPFFINNLYASDRSITYYKKLKKALEDNKVVLVDRYTTSSLCYQTALEVNLSKKDEMINYIMDYEYNKLGLRVPDQVIFLYAPFDAASLLLKKREDENGDIHEKNKEYLKKVYNNAIYISKKLNWDYIRCYEKGNLRSENDIQKDIFKLVLDKM